MRTIRILKKELLHIFLCVCFTLASVCCAAGDTETNISTVVPEPLQYCTVCHGTLFKGDFATGAPNLTGLPGWYLDKQLKAFKNSQRGTHAKDASGHEMRAAAEQLNNASIELAIKTITGIPKRSSVKNKQWQTLVFDQEPVKASLENGKKLFTTCASCHGVNAEGNKALMAPPLAGQDIWYTAKQLIHFRDGVRGQQDDSASALMKAATKILKTDQDIVDVVTYIDQLQ